ncbi:hypothetical protein [Celeribacter arenosi]|uniref:Epimerase n=1 Tax=Celeribacter arenosi TaxID=792649 RepID=A0ABP7KFJ6_9RHOB
MKILIFGATGMVGLGVLRECLLADDVTSVTTIGRTPLGQTHAKLHDITTPDLFALDAQMLDGFDACYFCLGALSGQMSEAAYTKLTYDLTLDIATKLATLNPAMTFVYVSGIGTDSSEQGKTMWARVKGRTENALRALPFKGVYLFRPGAILSLNGEQSKTKIYRRVYSVIGWLLRLLRPVARGYVLTSTEVGTAMLHVTRAGWSPQVMEPRDIQRAAAAAR